MNLQRITRVQVAIAGLAVVVGIALIFFFLFINPQRKAIDKATADAEYYEGENTRRPRVEEEIREAEETEKEVTAKYEEILETRMPKLDFTDPIAATVRMWDLAEEEQRLMDRWFASTGARVTGYSFPGWGANMPGSFPNPAWTHLDPLSWNLTIEVEDFPALLEWLLRIPEAPRFMELQNVTIQGPRQPGQPLVAQVPVVFYQWTGVEPASAPAPSAGAATTGRGMGGRGMGGRGMGGRGRGGRGMGGRGMGGRGMGGGGRRGF